MTVFKGKGSRKKARGKKKKEKTHQKCDLQHVLSGGICPEEAKVVLKPYCFKTLEVYTQLASKSANLFANANKFNYKLSRKPRNPVMIQNTLTVTSGCQQYHQGTFPSLMHRSNLGNRTLYSYHTSHLYFPLMPLFTCYQKTDRVSCTFISHRALQPAPYQSYTRHAKPTALCAAYTQLLQSHTSGAFTTTSSCYSRGRHRLSCQTGSHISSDPG